MTDAATAIATELRDAVYPSEALHGRGLPGATVRRVSRGDLSLNIYLRDNEPWLSTSTVLRVTNYTFLDPAIPPHVLEYLRQRGAWVDDAIRLWIEADMPDPASYALGLDRQLEAWKATAPVQWKNFTLAPYVTAFAAWCAAEAVQPTGAQVLVEHDATRTFGWVDVLTEDGPAEVKTSKALYRSHTLQVASYGDGGRVVRLDKTGTYEAVRATPDDVTHFAWLARSAHEIVASWADAT